MMTGDINIFIGDYQIEDFRLGLGNAHPPVGILMQNAAASAKRAALSLSFVCCCPRRALLGRCGCHPELSG